MTNVHKRLFKTIPYEERKQIETGSGEEEDSKSTDRAAYVRYAQRLEAEIRQTVTSHCTTESAGVSQVDEIIRNTVRPALSQLSYVLYSKTFVSREVRKTAS